VEELEATIDQLRKQVETVVAHVKEQDSKIQAVNDQIELNRNRRDVAQVDGTSDH
jgi:peptidoglycan hydrolase CwlO-like protein